MAAHRHDSLFCLFFIILSSFQPTNSSSCNLDFNKFPFEPGSECFKRAPTPPPCCDLALKPLFEAMAIEANRSRTIFLDPARAEVCTAEFQALHPRTDLTTCNFQNSISFSPSQNRYCSNNLDQIEGSLGSERLNDLRSSCRDLSTENYSEGVCFNCAVSYKSSLQVLEERSGSGSTGSNFCGGALLIAVASSNAGSVNWVQSLVTCLWDTNHFPGTMEKRKKGASKVMILSAIIVALLLALLAPILYKITRKRLRVESQKEIEDLSVTIQRKSLEYEREIPFTFSSFYVFSYMEIARATQNFNVSNMIGEGSTGKIYMGTMPSGQKVAVKRITKEHKVPTFAAEINHFAKIRHPNLVSILGYCNGRESCLVYEFCVNGDLANWLSGEHDSRLLTWEQRLRVASGIARGLRFLRNYPFGTIVHGEIKLTNILLDEKLEAKLSDYGLSKEKCKEANDDDVYSYGIMLLQLLTGRLTINQISSGPCSLVIEARSMVNKGENVCAFADPKLNGDFNVLAFERILSMAVLCTYVPQSEKPSLEDILKVLQEAQNLTT